MAVEAENSKKDQPDFPTFVFMNEPNQAAPRPDVQAPPVKRVVNVRVYKDEELRLHPPEWLDEQLIIMSGKTRRPMGDVFIRKLRTAFPSLDKKVIIGHVERLIREGKIISAPTLPLGPAVGADQPTFSAPSVSSGELPPQSSGNVTTGEAVIMPSSIPGNIVASTEVQALVPTIHSRSEN
jgi:hypothetical protein